MQVAVNYIILSLLVDFALFEGSLVPLNSHFKLGKCLAFSRYGSPHACDLFLSTLAWSR